MSDDLAAILEANAERRAAQREQAAEHAAQAADVIDRLAHPNEADHEREARREAEAERQRLKALGVAFDA